MVARGDVINFNPILADVKYSEIDKQVKKVEEEAKNINRDYLEMDTLRQCSEQLYNNQSAFVVNTGFRLRLRHETETVDVTYIDMNDNIEQLEILAKKVKGKRVSEIPVEDLVEIERLFANLEDFYHGHMRLISSGIPETNIPLKQKKWSQKAHDIRQYLKDNFSEAIFDPENVHDDLKKLYQHSGSILNLALPEFLSLQGLTLRGKLYLRSPVIDYIFKSTWKIQALIRGDLKDVQDIHALHKLAQREFGPMTAGIVGFNELHIKNLSSIVDQIRRNKPLLKAVIMAFIFQDLGQIPSLREKYKGEINPADQAQAGAVLLKREKIPQRYNMAKESEKVLVFLVRTPRFYSPSCAGGRIFLLCLERDPFR